MEEGTDVENKLIASHDLDVTWRPSEEESPSAC